MKKTFCLILSAFVFLSAALCGEVQLNFEKGEGIQFNQKIKNEKNLTVIDGKKCDKTSVGLINLSEYGNQDVTISIEGEIKVVSSAKKDSDIIWMVNDYDAKFPVIAGGKCKNDRWMKLSGKKTFHLGSDKNLYISPASIDKDTVTIYLRNFNVKISGELVGNVDAVNWMDAPSLKEAYKDYFDYIGFATPYWNVLSSPMYQEGLKKHVSCITMENEMKPDGFLGSKNLSNMQEFTGEDGTVINVPGNLPNYNNVDSALGIAKKCGLQMRGHVLVWHSQTPDWFFHEDYNSKNAFVTPEVMNARMEWYIKSVLEHIAAWENENNDGKRIVKTWDVVNEAISDSANNQKWLRNSKSGWYSVYKNEDFIINAFRYANKYAPKDVLLAYNDYGIYNSGKLKAALKIIDLIQATPDARIDVIGIQSHVSLSNPMINGGTGSMEDAVKKFTAKGVDVQITELDIAAGGKVLTQEKIAAKYKDYFKMFIRNRKTEDKHGISGVTLWGVTDERSWIYKNKDGVNMHQSPLLFYGNVYCKKAFFTVLEAAEESK